ncbi:HNH endonuclease [Micromonospora sp. IBSANI012]|uniref:HNH endonuclease n=1 Tax=Micromonospora sp. IBSANI012 TaxID=3457761 RepID=UPI0040582B04
MVRRWTQGPCPVCQTGRTFHADCLYAALTWAVAGTYDIETFPPIVRRLAPSCYLCGLPKVEHAEHVHPRLYGGTDTWSNMAGSCRHCNLRKGAAVGSLSEEQRQRAAEQQTLYRAAFRRCSDAVVTAGLNYHGHTPEELMSDGYFELDLTDEQLLRFFTPQQVQDARDTLELLASTRSVWERAIPHQ